MMTEGAAGLASTASQRQRQDDRGAATRERLIDGAYSILRERGLAGLRSANISEVSGVSRGGLLHHYPTKEMLIAAVYERIVADMHEATLDRIASVDDAAVLDEIIADAQQRFFSDAYRVMLDILLASGEEAPFAAVLEALKQRRHEAPNLAWGARLAATGVDRNLAMNIASYLWYLVQGLAVRGLATPSETHDSRVIARGLKVARKRLLR